MVQTTGEIVARAVTPVIPPVVGAPELSGGGWLLTERQAKQLCGGQLPRFGYEKLVEARGYRYWLGRTRHLDKMAWWARLASGQVTWQFSNGMQCVL